MTSRDCGDFIVLAQSSAACKSVSSKSFSVVDRAVVIVSEDAKGENEARLSMDARANRTCLLDFFSFFMLLFRERILRASGRSIRTTLSLLWLLEVVPMVSMMGEKEEFGSSGFTVKTDPVQVSETDASYPK